ncbi:hypothetical protein KSP40_PGU006969 [Platanthera guangdongensis]|uniref:Uncharacterized protein n=1 Tax=Platanthera guangdongensis TaxID=2320717 RepID=A0ABR2MDJ9_9ASPA
MGGVKQGWISGKYLKKEIAENRDRLHVFSRENLEKCGQDMQISHFRRIHFHTNLAGLLLSFARHSRFFQNQVSTLTIKDKLLVAGGFQGELILRTGIQSSWADRTEPDRNWMEPRSDTML